MKKKNRLGDVERFLSAFVDQAAERGVELITRRMEDAEGRHCLLGEMVVRGLPERYHGSDAYIEGALTTALGISWHKVVDVMSGWDGNPSRYLPYRRMGARLRTRYQLRKKKREAMSA